MPLYEYECEACGHRLEAQQKLADAPLTKCPHCGKKKLQKLISHTSFTLKGGGWYKDLYASAKPGESSGSSEKKDSSSTDSPSSASSEKADKADKVDKPSTEKSTSDKAGTTASESTSKKAAASSSSTSPAKAKKS
jgi:putative FmdB family regulatory protein